MGLSETYFLTMMHIWSYSFGPLPGSNPVSAGWSRQSGARGFPFLALYGTGRCTQTLHQVQCQVNGYRSVQVLPEPQQATAMLPIQH